VWKIAERLWTVRCWRQEEGAKSSLSAPPCGPTGPASGLIPNFQTVSERLYEKWSSEGISLL